MNDDYERSVYDGVSLWFWGFVIAAIITYALYKSAGN